ncbi:STAS domain-containing protein [Streptomyces sp. E11-3]|uniref:STAS domain-containing protein n=1 Tax=Streptomyces sp. E11-3 TaxID=3110112 RepID=UPI0039801B7E
MRERILGEAAVLELHGEIDFLATAELTPRIEALTAHQAADLIVDLTRVSFMDAGGLRLLVRVRDHVACRGGELRVVRGAPRVMRLFRITGLEYTFAFVDCLPGQSRSGGDDDNRPPPGLAAA